MVQGVGFRPFVHGLATSLNLTGVVRNVASGVNVEVQGEPAALDEFLLALRAGAPPLASIHAVTSAPAAVRVDRAFVIATSAPQASGADTESIALIPPDVATCDACLAEFSDPADRRYRHPFISCTDCGPRFTVVTDTPYDRPRTTMRAFPICAACRREYRSPGDRRFHAQTIACHECGPVLALARPCAAAVTRLLGEAALRGAVAGLARGEIVAVKGLGGYHLACDALNAVAVAHLRSRKHRDARPLAIMVRDLAAARALCVVNEREAAHLRSAARPIVVLSTRPDLPPATLLALEALAPRIGSLGVMLPYTPVHHLLLDGAGRPLVMTSGNRGGEPIACDDDDAFARLGDVADAFLTHDRAIAARSDDSVVRVGRDGAVPIRRSRGIAPEPLLLTEPAPVPILAMGGHLKNTFCLVRRQHAFLSPHVGDLEHPDTAAALAAGIRQYERLFRARPGIVAHDRHPDYLSTGLAQDRTDATLVPVQHHHAHVASCLAEHGLTGPVIGVVFDGAGLGDDGAVWGGEFLLADARSYQRLAHLAYIPLPGGDAAARQPWRVAAAHLWSAYQGNVDDLPIPFLRTVIGSRWPLLRRMIERGLGSPPTSSVGRLFDAVASLVGLRHASDFEGQAATELESLAASTSRSYPVALVERGGEWLVDAAPLIRAIVEDLAAGRLRSEIAGAFHNAVTDVVTGVARRIRESTGVTRVVLTGGVFQNVRLADGVAAALAAQHFEVFTHHRVPCNDGGLSLGQAVVAAATVKAA